MNKLSAIALRTTLAAGAAAVALGLSAFPAVAAEYPSKAITIVVHTGPGGGMDLFGREIAKRLQTVLRQPVVVENRPGGSSAVAMQYAASQPTDGYTLIGITDTLIITPIKNKTPKSLKDFVPVAHLLTDPNVLFVKSDNKYKSIKEMLADLKAGTRLRIAQTQVGSPESTALLKLVNNYGLRNIVPVPVQDGGAGVTSVLGGHLVASLAEPAEIGAQIEAKQVRVLATFTTKRIPQMSEVPTFNELGYDVAIDKFRGIAAPKGTPRNVVATLEKALKQVLDGADYKKVYDANFQIPNFMGSDEFAKFLVKKEASYASALATKK
ncbi:MAG: tripartite tricarboxylate transporter substrate binding protein [Betaproteobacteria bacterium]|nr:tripartite tricarboxylate transporter substrate binding protein [Betaproteobacteria bacterium]